MDQRMITLPYSEYEGMIKYSKELEDKITELTELLNDSDKKVIVIEHNPYFGYLSKIYVNKEEKTDEYVRLIINSIASKDSYDDKFKNWKESLFNEFRNEIRRKLENGSFLTRMFTTKIMNILYDRHK